MLNNLSMGSKPASTQSGNALFIVLIAIALFAALSFTVSRSSRNGSGQGLSDAEAKLAASEILSYSQKIARGVDRVRQRGVSESDISFDDPALSGYSHGQPDDHKVFLQAGGGVKYIAPAQGVNDGSAWIFTGATCIEDIGSGATGCDSDTDDSNEELLIVLSNVGDTACDEINKAIDIDDIPADTGGGASSTKFTGSFADGTEIILADGPYSTACFSYSGANYFYRVLLAR